MQPTALLSACVVLAVSAVSAQAAERVVLPGVDQYRVTEPLFEGIRVILNQRGEAYSPAYICGISGAAFRIGGPCPCAPTCEVAMSSERLIELLGYKYEFLPSNPPPGDGAEGHREFGATVAERVPRIIDRVRDEIRAGRPALVWTAFTPYEYDVVCGFDDEKHELYGRGAYSGGGEYVSAPADHMLKGADVGMGVILIGDKTGSFDARTVEIDALRQAVAHAHGMASSMGGKAGTGLRCYDMWIEAYRDQDGWFHKGSPPNDGYMLLILSGTRKAAGDFCRELAPKYPEVRTHLEMAAMHFDREAEALATCLKLKREKQLDGAEGATRAAAYLSEARAMYALGIDEVAAALRTIGR